MAVRDAAPYVDEAVDSVLAQLGPDDELVVVDDGSTDATPHRLAARADALTLVSSSPIGLSRARNLALDHCSGRYLGFIDADDRWAPGSLDRLVGALDADPTVDLVLGRTDEFLDPAVTDPAAFGLRAPQRDVLGWFLGALLVRREVADAVRFDPENPLSMTSDWLARARVHGLTEVEIPEVTLHRRLRPGSMTTDGLAYRASMLRTLRQNLRRTRAG
jgi:glycosyltransferase involved in cell wall biosynthesis